MQLEKLFVFTLGVSLLASWCWWVGVDRRKLNGARVALSVSALLVMSVAFFMYGRFIVGDVTNRSGEPSFRFMLSLARPGLWLSFAALVLCLAGKGVSRVLMLVTTLLMITFWIIPVWGM